MLRSLTSTASRHGAAEPSSAPSSSGAMLRPSKTRPRFFAAAVAPLRSTRVGATSTIDAMKSKRLPGAIPGLRRSGR